jgi:hypothetical protein
MVLSIIILEDKHKILFHLSIFDEYQRETPTGNFSDVYFFLIFDKNNERPHWMNDLKH